MYIDLYKDDYANAMFEHFKLEPEKGTDNGKYKCSFIIQTAFNLYIMWLAFMDAVSKNNPDGDLKDDENEANGTQEFTEALKFYQSCYLRSVTKSPRAGGEGTRGRRAAKYRPRNQATTKSIGEEQVKNDIIANRKITHADCFMFYEKSILTVEVVRADGALERAYFFKLPYFDAITKDIKTKFNRSVSRISPKTKCFGLLQHSQVIIERIKREHMIKGQLIMAFISNNLTYIRYFTIMLAMIMNLIILLYVEKDAEDNKKTIDNWQNTWLLRGLGIFLVIYSYSIIYYSLYQRYPEIKRRLKEEYPIN